MNFEDFDKLKSAYDLRGTELHVLNEHVASLEKEIARLKELLDLQKDRIFGKKSEASNHVGVANDVSPPLAPKTNVTAHTRNKRGHRKLDPTKLPKYTVIHDMPKEQQVCQFCSKALHLIGKEISEQLEIIPSRYCLIEHIRMKYGCRPCEAIIMSPKPPAPIPKAIAGASLLTDVILNKYQYHLPLYRQSKIMQSYGVQISDKTLANWVTACGEGLLPIYDALWVILKNRYLQVDETPVKLLETNKNGYMWTYFAPDVGKGLVVFEFSETRAGSVAFERLKTFKGLLHSDGYSGYTALRKREGIVGFGCLSHARRKFSEVVKIKGERHDLATEMIERMKLLYELEERFRKAKAPHRIRKKLRQKIAWPILKSIYKWLHTIKPNILPKSKLGLAIQYMLNQWPYLIAYLQHGMAEIDTNYVENKIREIALGKKNWLFVGNKESGKIHCLFFSLIISAVLNNINPRVYIHYLLEKIHDLRRGTIDPISLLPDRINCEALEKFAEQQISFGKEMLSKSEAY